jgi:hypothetical protein
LHFHIEGEWEEIFWLKDGQAFVTGPEINITTQGTYTVVAEDAAGCILQDEIVVNYSTQEIMADFLLPTEGVINDPVVAIDITWPVPVSIAWEYDDSEATLIVSTNNQIILTYPEPGVYTIGMHANIGVCSDFLEKQIRIYSSRDSIQNPLPPMNYQLINSFEIFPNPNMGDFSIRLILSMPHTADIWLFSERGELIVQNTLQGQSYYEIPFQGNPLPAGVYTAIARVGNEWIYLNFIVLS